MRFEVWGIVYTLWQRESHAAHQQCLHQHLHCQRQHELRKCNFSIITNNHSQTHIFLSPGMQR